MVKDLLYSIYGVSLFSFKSLALLTNRIKLTSFQCSLIKFCPTELHLNYLWVLATDILYSFGCKRNYWTLCTAVQRNSKYIFNISIATVAHAFISQLLACTFCLSSAIIKMMLGTVEAGWLRCYRASVLCQVLLWLKAKTAGPALGLFQATADWIKSGINRMRNCITLLSNTKSKI